MSLRKEKAARLKLSVLDHTIKLIGKKSFDDLYVEEICAKVKISKVTLFKYFPQKEDILLYYFRIWCLKRAVEFRDKPREGVAGITYLFDKLAEDCEAHPGIILSLFAYLADLKRPPKPFPVKAEEKKLIFPEVKDIQLVEIQSLDQMFEKFTLEAIFKKEITKTASTRDLTNLLSTIFYGSVVTAHIQQLSPVKFFFRRNIEMVLKGLQ
ncbi:MAG: TetR/AcrR family transcriptional regulator [Cyclobacteriaceae bacterium]|nr:TetR/AcrR family transcriptional regulator [Cyclobacteriaceae bacterium]